MHPPSIVVQSAPPSVHLPGRVVQICSVHNLYIRTSQIAPAAVGMELSFKARVAMIRKEARRHPFESPFACMADNILTFIRLSNKHDNAEIQEPHCKYTVSF